MFPRSAEEAEHIRIGTPSTISPNVYICGYRSPEGQANQIALNHSAVDNDDDSEGRLHAVENRAKSRCSKFCEARTSRQTVSGHGESPGMKSDI